MKSTHCQDMEKDLEPPKKTIKFRNYTPKDEQLKTKTLPKPKPVRVADTIAEHLEKGKEDAPITDVDLSTLAPRKPDWDLKRDVNKKLEKLERRTQKAIIELIRERLSDGDLATAVSAMTDK